MVRQDKFTPYPKEMLPSGFKYPKSYLDLSQSTNTINYDEKYFFPWWFEDYGTEGAEIAYRYRKFNSSISNNAIPFANYGEWEAYFDGDDISGNPKVIVVNLENTENYEVFTDFDTWLKEAENDGW